MSNRSNIEEVTFGVEIETTIPQEKIGVGQYHVGLPVSGYYRGPDNSDWVAAPKFNGACWKAEVDGSIRVRRVGYEPCEFVSPILKGEAGVKHLIEFVAWLKELGAMVNPSCGLHIHIGVAGVSGANGNQDAVIEYLNKVARVAAFNADALFAQTGTLNRERGRYCAKPGTQYKAAVREVCREKQLQRINMVGRYNMLNLTTVAGRGTMEFRCFAGTLNIEKILLHLFSAISICFIARNVKTVPIWDNQQLTGTEALKNFLKVRPMLRLVRCEPFEDYWAEMLDRGFKMAAKYDAAKFPQAIAQVVEPAAATPTPAN